jgi:hypothetical protein
MTNGIDREARERELREILRRIRAEFEGRYQPEIDGLLGLSRAEIDAISPDTTDLEVYSQLLEVVKDASRRNLAQAELKGRIEELGDTAVRIATKVAGLAKLFV